MRGGSQGGHRGSQGGQKGVSTCAKEAWSACARTTARSEPALRLLPPTVAVTRSAAAASGVRSIVARDAFPAMRPADGRRPGPYTHPLFGSTSALSAG